jgi:hypothetical protein
MPDYNEFWIGPGVGLMRRKGHVPVKFKSLSEEYKREGVKTFYRRFFDRGMAAPENYINEYWDWMVI